MRVLHVIGSISRTGGGPSRSSQGLVAALRGAGIEVWLMTLNHGEEPWIKGVEKFVNGGKFEDALQQIEPDIVHLHGIWQIELHRCAVICRRWGIPYVIAPRGMLEPWSLKAKWLKKRIARFLYQDHDLRMAAALHATAESESEQFRKLGFKNSVIVSPNGVNLPEEDVVVDRRARPTKERMSFISAEEQRRRAEEKVMEWLNGVAEADFDLALTNLVEEKSGAGEYLFKQPGDKNLALTGARRFFREFARKIVVLSDGRCVYFVPDARAKLRGVSLVQAWAEYAYHAVSAGGRLIPGRDYCYRHFNEAKCEILDRVEDVIRSEQCIAVIEKKRPERDAVHFVGTATGNRRFDVVTRLDEYGNANANLSEVTIVLTKRKTDKNPPPKVRPLTEVVEAAAKHQAAGFSPSTTLNSVANSDGDCKGLPPSLLTEAKVSEAEAVCRALFVSRMHPKKGVLELVEAWRRIKSANWQCELVYTLNGEEERAYEAQVKQRILDLGMSYQDRDGNIHSATPTPIFNFILTGPLSDDKKWEAYARADLFVLPTYSENFGIVVAEALWAGVPVITTKGTPWADLIAYRCGWWIDLPTGDGRKTWPTLDSALREATSTSDADLRSLGQNGHTLVETKYSWPAAAKAMIAGYERVLAAI